MGEFASDSRAWRGSIGAWRQTDWKGEDLLRVVAPGA
ncbi:hypothetical protein A2U01_0025091, partial [Trifolium medium]|nr:hypothetical protein [Trifolium medium]